MKSLLLLCSVLVIAQSGTAIGQGSLRKVVYGEKSSSPEAKKTAAPKKPVVTKKTAPKPAPAVRTAAVKRTRPGTSTTRTTTRKPARQTLQKGMINVVFTSKDPGTDIFVNGNPVGRTDASGIFHWGMTPGSYRIRGVHGTNVVFAEKQVDLRIQNTRVPLIEEKTVAAKTPDPAPIVLPPTEAELEMEKAREISARVIKVFSDFLDPQKSDQITSDDWQFVSEAAVLGGFQNLSGAQIEAQRSFANGRVELAQKNPSKALTSFQLSIQSFPSSPLPFIGMGDAYFSSGQFSDARKSYEQAETRGKHLPIIHRRLGDTYRQLKERKRAVESYSEAVKLGDTRYETRLLRARAMVEADMIVAAIPVLEELLKEGPKADIYFALGEAYELSKRDVAALDHYRKSVELDPESALAHYRLARIYYEQREFENAAKGFDAALRLDGDKNTFSHEDAAMKRMNALRRIKSDSK